jgi:hypothetical protein
MIPTWPPPWNEFMVCENCDGCVTFETVLCPSCSHNLNAITMLNKQVDISVVYRNWAIHNLIAHPLSEIIHWLTSWKYGSRISGWVHDITIPLHNIGTGRG